MTSPFRSLQPAPKLDGHGKREDDQNSSLPPSKRKRAPLTMVACLKCREKKTKVGLCPSRRQLLLNVSQIQCDGQKPFCNACIKRKTTECRYEHQTEAHALREKNAGLSREIERLRSQTVAWPVEPQIDPHYDAQPENSQQTLQGRLDFQTKQIVELQNELHRLKGLLPTLAYTDDRDAALLLVEEIQRNGVSEEARNQADAMLRVLLESPIPSPTLQMPRNASFQSSASTQDNLAGSPLDLGSLSRPDHNPSGAGSQRETDGSPFEPFVSWDGLTLSAEPDGQV